MREMNSSVGVEITGHGVRGITVVESYLNLQLNVQEGLRKVDHLKYLFGDFSNRIETAASPEHVIEMMDTLGIRRAQFNVQSWGELPAARAILERYPTRFAAALRVDPHQGMTVLREIEAAYRDLPGLLTSISVVPFLCSPATPPNDKHYYPLYAKCMDLQLPVNINVGLPGPRMPGSMQHPLYLDEVCFDFPDLKIVMRHGGDPWADVCAKLLLKWPNLYYCTDAWSPRHYRSEILDFANKRDASKIIYGGYYPALSYERIFQELAELPLRDHVWEPFLSVNAQRVYKL